MSYKVFLVEDEVVTREGIRDNVDWRASGFEFCGEASDGEMALPLLRTAKPDVLITDIKMPFIDGLQLSKIMRERMPWVKVIILSGHDEFEYAQQAIKLGVTDYLLKPITVQNLQSALQKLTAQLDDERKERENLKRLQEQAEENRATLRERFLFKLIVGAVSPAEAVENGQLLELNLIARHYLVMILKIEPDDRSGQPEHDGYQQIQNMVVGLIEKDPDIFVLKRDWGDLVLIFKGHTLEYLEESRDSLLDEIRREVGKTRYKLTIGMGTAKNRIADICQSFIEALTRIQNPPGDEDSSLHQPLERMELLKVDKVAVENYLHSGKREGFDEFFNAYLLPLSEAALKSNLIKNYIFVDVVLAIAKLVDDLGGEVDKVIPELNSIELIMSNIKTIEELRAHVYKIIMTALAYRDGQPKGQYKDLIRQAKEYIERHYTDPDLSLNIVAARANLSASHFSVVFSQETAQNFKEYLTEVRINKAKELLRMTSLRSADIAYQVGYNDPHYFSAVFKKHTGQSPIEFRSQV
ncbi:MAG: response regulator [Chloroflexi bacterium]|nr:response regulator [Chloroflexota bacterium]